MNKASEKHKQALIDDLTHARENLIALVKEFPAEQLDAPCVGIWSVKDLVAHLIGWDNTNYQAVQEILSGQRPSFFQYYDADWQRYNSTLVATYRVEPFEALMFNAAESHRALVGFLQSLRAEDILLKKSPKEAGRSITIRNLLRSEAEDERKHAAQLEAFLGQIIPEKDIE